MAHADILGQEGTALSRLATVSNPVHSPNSASWSFAEDYIAPSPDVAEARDEATVHTITPISTGVAATLTMLTRAVDAKAVVEVGTLMGASGLSVAYPRLGADGAAIPCGAHTPRRNVAQPLLCPAEAAQHYHYS